MQVPDVYSKCLDRATLRFSFLSLENPFYASFDPIFVLFFLFRCCSCPHLCYPYRYPASAG